MTFASRKRQGRPNFLYARHPASPRARPSPSLASAFVGRNAVHCVLPTHPGEFVILSAVARKFVKLINVSPRPPVGGNGHSRRTARKVTIAGLDSDYYRKAFVRGGRPK